MDNHQITQSIQAISELKWLYKGCFYNKTIPFGMFQQKDCFFIVNTITDTRNMGHWILFFIRNYHLYYFDSFAMDPSVYGGDISNYFKSYHGYKTIVVENPVQNDFSYVCGAYAIIFAYFMSRDNSLPYIKSMFTKNTCKNDKFVVTKLYSLTGFTLACNKLSCKCNYSICKNFCEC